jgi:hypothetical protein
MQGGRDREATQRACRQHCGYAVVALSAFEHCFGQLLNEKWHAIGALDDLVNDLAAKARIACEPVDQCRAVMPAEPVQCQCGYLRCPLQAC